MVYRSIFCGDLTSVKSSPTPDGPWCNIDVALYQLSGQPHPEAQRPQIHILQVDETWGQPSVSIEIVGDTLAVIIYYAFDFEHVGSRLFLRHLLLRVILLLPSGIPC